jgi:hypothetical protein
MPEGILACVFRRMLPIGDIPCSSFFQGPQYRKAAHLGQCRSKAFVEWCLGGLKSQYDDKNRETLLARAG